MRENFDLQLSKISNLKNADKKSQLLDDLSTAYISSYADNKHLDESLLYVKMTRKYLRSQGFTNAEINDYLLERSYISKTDLRKLKTESIYLHDSVSIAPHIENKIERHNSRTTTDLLIAELKKRPELLSCLQRGVNESYIKRRFKMHNPTLLKNFYNKHKSIIDD
jgi:hypothetical protein